MVEAEILITIAQPFIVALPKKLLLFLTIFSFNAYKYALLMRNYIIFVASLDPLYPTGQLFTDW